MEGRNQEDIYIDFLYPKCSTLKWLFKANFTAARIPLPLAG